MLQLVQVRIFSSSFWVQCTNSSACMERQVPLTKRFSPIVLPDPLSISLSLQCLGPSYRFHIYWLTCISAKRRSQKPATRAFNLPWTGKCPCELFLTLSIEVTDGIALKRIGLPCHYSTKNILSVELITNQSVVLPQSQVICTFWRPWYWWTIWGTQGQCFRKQWLKNFSNRRR